MPSQSRTFWLPRRGHDSAEYEDAFAVDEDAGRFAVADGATEGCFTGLWAKLLVEDFIGTRKLGVGEWVARVPALQERWNAMVSVPSLPWYAEQGVRHGASAAFLGLVAARSTDSCDWQAVAVGDTCLFHTRHDALLRAFPLDRAEQFDNFPKLVGSCMCIEDIRARQIMWTDGRGQTGDRLWMMTDALAQGCLGEIEAGRSPWADLTSLLALPEAQNSFVAWIELLRDDGRLRNDDVTLLAIEL